MQSTRKFWLVLTGALLGMAIIACSCGPIMQLLTGTPTPTQVLVTLPPIPATLMPILPPVPTLPPVPATLAPTSSTRAYDKLPYQDDFSNPQSGWDVYNTDNDSAGYKDGFYFVISKTTQFSSYGTPGKFFADTVIDVDATPYSGPTDNNFSYNVGCRDQKKGDGYVFEIEADGYYAVGYYTGGGQTYASLLSGDEWQSSSAIKQGLVTNHITVTCSGSNLVFAVNGQVLYQGQDSTFSDGDISLGAATYASDNTPAEVHFKALVVKAP